MTRRFAICVLGVGIAWAVLLCQTLTFCQEGQAAELQRFKFTEPHMGVPFTLLFYAADQNTANRASKAAFERINQLNSVLSDYDPNSELSRLSRTSGTRQTVRVSDNLWHMLVLSSQLSRRTGGAFDITVGPYVKQWRNARRNKRLPSEKKMAAARRAVGHRYIHLDHRSQSCRLEQPGMRLDLGGIAKGYAADEALRVLRDQGITRALVDGSGDIAIGDPPPDRSGWKVGIARLEANAPPSRYLLLSRSAIATSGDTWQFVIIDGQRYSHIIDPRTGLGLRTRSSVTIIAPDCTTADSLASAVSVLGPEAGLRLVEDTCGVATLIARRVDEKILTFESKRMKMLLAIP